MDSEPHDALYACKKGLDVVKPFLKQAREHLNPAGEIWMEFGSEQKEVITNLPRDYNYYGSFNCTFHKDQYGNWRFVVIK